MDTKWSRLTLRISYRRPWRVNREAELKALSAVSCMRLLDGESKTMNEYEPIAMAFWTKEADKIIAADNEKYREYHATVLKGTWERGWIEALQWAASQIVPDGNPEVALEKIELEIKRMVKPSNT